MKLAIAHNAAPLEAGVNGAVCVGETRVTLDAVVTAFEEGAMIEEIVHPYPARGRAAAYAANGYYLRQGAEVRASLAQRHPRSNEIRQENETRFEAAGVRARLLSRRSHGNENSRVRLAPTSLLLTHIF